MGLVYLAEHIGLKKQVAVKELRPGSNQRESVMRFRDEAIYASAVDHEGIINIRDIIVTEDGRWFMEMDLLEGESLFERINRLYRKGERISILSGLKTSLRISGILR